MDIQIKRSGLRVSNSKVFSSDNSFEIVSFVQRFKTKTKTKLKLLTTLSARCVQCTRCELYNGYSTDI